ILSNRKCFGFGNLDPFAQGGVESHVSRSAEPTVTAVAGGIGLWILKNNVAVTIDDNLVRKTPGEICISAKIRKRRALGLQTREVLNETVLDLYLSKIIWQGSYEVCRVRVLGERKCDRAIAERLPESSVHTCYSSCPEA